MQHRYISRLLATVAVAAALATTSPLTAGAAESVGSAGSVGSASAAGASQTDELGRPGLEWEYCIPGTQTFAPCIPRPCVVIPVEPPIDGPIDWLPDRLLDKLDEKFGQWRKPCLPVPWPVPHPACPPKVDVCIPEWGTPDWPTVPLNPAEAA